MSGLGKAELVVFEPAWAAGLFDGEGTTSCLKAQRDRYAYPRLSMAQKEPEVLERLQKLLGGRIYKSKTRSIYNWNLYTQEAVEEALNVLWPFLSRQKKQQALKVFEHVESINNAKESTRTVRKTSP